MEVSFTAIKNHVSFIAQFACRPAPLPEFLAEFASEQIIPCEGYTKFPVNRTILAKTAHRQAAIGLIGFALYFFLSASFVARAS